MIFFDFLFDHARLAVTFSGNTGPGTPNRAAKIGGRIMPGAHAEQ
jgi:hypothetical protein